MRLSQLEYFIKVAQCGSITKAAQELFLSQPSLTKAIASLETEYQIKLFDRTPKGIQLTPQGRTFLEYAQAAVNACQTLEDTFGNTKKQTIQRLSVASQQFDFLYDLLLQVQQGCGAEPFQIDLEETDRGSIIHRLEQRQADLGLLVLSQRDRKKLERELQYKALEVHTLDYSPVYVSMGRLSPLYDQPIITAAQAAEQLHIVLDTEKTLRRDLLLPANDVHVDPTRLIFCNTISACLHFLEKTDALLYTPKWVLGMLADHQIHSVILRENDGSYFADINRLVWVKRQDERLTPLEQILIQQLQQKFATAE